MENNQKDIAVKKAIMNHADILNKAAVRELYTCYSEDAVFMPDGREKLDFKAIKNLKSADYLRESQFHISYSIQEIIIDGIYAFVNALATTKTNEGNKVISRKSNDFVVLKALEAGWKIYRHTFNNVTVIKN